MPLLELPLITALAGPNPAYSPFPMSAPLFAEISGPHVIAIVAIVSGISLTAVFIVYGLKFVQRRQELWHETARVALEKGQPLPPLPSDMRSDKDPAEANDFRTGLILVATGAGLYFFFLSLFGGWMAYVGAIPGFIGIALLLFATLNAWIGRKDKPSDRPPQT